MVLAGLSQLRLFDCLIAVVVVLAYRIVSYFVRSSRKGPGPTTRRIMVVLGSGGHTSEMFQALECLPETFWASRQPVYVVSDSDKDSAEVAKDFELQHGTIERCERCRILRIPRAREVGQSYVTSIGTTLYAWLKCILVAFEEDPDVLLTNGPGVCIPVVAATYFVGVLLGRSRASVVYMESFTCVDHLSMSGKLLLRIADVFTVQWTTLEAKLARRWGCRSRVLFAGPRMDLATPPLLPNGSFFEQSAPKSATDPLCLVTVGSTKFDALMRAIDCPEFFESLVALGIRDLIVQRGRSTYAFQCKAPSLLMHPPTIVEYKAQLVNDIRRASLLITHAGAGTILEAVASQTVTLVVPNDLLMSNHQLQLAEGLAKERFVLYAYPKDVISTLQKMVVAAGASAGAVDPAVQPAQLRQFPLKNREGILAALSRVFGDYKQDGMAGGGGAPSVRKRPTTLSRSS